MWDQRIAKLLILSAVFILCSKKDAGGAVEASHAREFIDSEQTVVGKVVQVSRATKANGRPTYINFDQPFPNHSFSAVIFEDTLKTLSYSPEIAFKDRVVSVTGRIEVYMGKPQIKVRKAEQIRLFQEERRLPNKALKKDGSLELLCNDPLVFEKPLATTKSVIGAPLVELLRKARSSIDFAIYGIRNQPEVARELEAALARGVQVRGVVDNDTEEENYYDDTEALQKALGTVKTDYLVDIETSQMQDEFDLEPFWPAPVGFKGPAQCIGYSLADNKAIIAVHASRKPIEFKGDIMHNKFFVIDEEIVWTGSCNISDSCSGGYNANVAVLLHSREVASWYLREFNQMYKSSKFHRRKDDLARGSELKTVLEDDTEVSAFFSPQGYAMEDGLRPVLQGARNEIDIAIFFLTHKYLVADLIKAHQRGVKVRIIIDGTGARNEYSKHQLLRAAGIPVKVENWGGKMHAKAVVVDQQFVVAGSMNWTTAGERTNDENTIVIKSPRIAAQFSTYYNKLWHSVDDRWLHEDPDPESKDSGTSWNDGIDNDFDHLIDKEDPGTSSSPPPLKPLPPYRIVEKKEGNDLIKGSIRDGKKVYYLPNHPNYNDVDIGSSGKWFPSTWEAKEDGWEKAR